LTSANTQRAVRGSQGEDIIMAGKRTRLIQRRKSLGFTQESLAAALEVDRTTIERWENGRRAPQPWVRPRLARELQLSVIDLDGLINAPDTDGRARNPSGADWDLPEIDDMQRRDVLHMISLVGTAMALPASSAPAGSPAFARHAQLNAHLWQVCSLSTAKGEVMPLVRRQLATLADELTKPHGHHAHRQLCILTGDMFQLAGEIFFDANAYTDAASCYVLAAHASKDADAFDLWACAMTRHAYLAVYERRFAAAVPMLELAETLAQRGDGALSTRYWVATVQAETFAGLGDFSSCQRALDTADRVRDLQGPEHNGGWLRFDGSRLAEERGNCYTRCGRFDLAEVALDEALRHAMSPRRRASVLTDLAAIGAHRRDPDQVKAYADIALREVRQSGSGMISHKLGELQQHLQPLLDNRQIARLDAEIDALRISTM
jgi:transcriptional regulator with XRE-family HTH domain/tetratricopeptide (TPR) repeat protein